MNTVEIKFTQSNSHTGRQSSSVQLSGTGDELELLVSAIQATAVTLGFTQASVARIALLPPSSREPLL